jgi:hypothetical protein
MLRDTLGRSSSISFSTSSATPLVSRHCEPLCPSLEQRGCRAAERQNDPVQPVVLDSAATDGYVTTTSCVPWVRVPRSDGKSP